MIRLFAIEEVEGLNLDKFLWSNGLAFYEFTDLVKKYNTLEEVETEMENK